MRSKNNPRTPRRAVFQALLLLLGIGFVTGAAAQTSTVGSINGTVRDPTGAAIPRTDVVIQEERTGFSRTATTNDEGFYSFPTLPVGRYSVTASPQGFQKTV